ncbi:MAG: GNAT family N-acetyltransferase [Campylobacterota bacterium]|nr:GNAT family N-acetyltransferase [Campylobacterota bacterium]
MITPTLYFLRSSEQKIATDILHYAARLDEVGKTLADFPELSIYNRYYGLSHRDIGLYTLSGTGVSGGAWIRLIAEDKGANAFIDSQTPILSIAVKPEFRSQGIGSMMLEQLLQEAGSRYEQISVSVLDNSPAMKFFEKFGFIKHDAPHKKSPVDAKPVITMLKTVSKDAVQRPNDGYNPSRWMD